MFALASVPTAPGVPVEASTRLTPVAAPTNAPFWRVASNAKKSSTALTPGPLYTVTRAAPPLPAAATMSARPSPFTSATATRMPPVNVASTAKNDASVALSVPLMTMTRGPPPWSAPATMSGTPSPLKSPAATYTPPVNAASNGA